MKNNTYALVKKPLMAFPFKIVLYQKYFWHTTQAF